MYNDEKEDTMIEQEKYVKKICEKLGILENTIKNYNSLRYFDINISAENLYAGLLNRVYGWNLQNANYVSKNAAAIDLVDHGNRIAVQVSSDKTSKKIAHTITEYKNNAEEISGYRLIMFFVTGKQKTYRNQFDTEGMFSFNKKRDIWDNTTVLHDLGNMPLGKLKEVAEFLMTELSALDRDDNQTDTHQKKRKKTNYKDHSFFKTNQFRKEWKKSMFLDEKLSLHSLYGGIDGFLMTDYEEKDEEGIIHRKANLANRLLDTYRGINTDNESFANDEEKSLVILGPPGIGKSTLMEWLCNCKRKEDILAYSFADLFDKQNGEEVRYGKKGLDYILARAGLKTDSEIVSLHNKVLLLDGLDEVSGEIEEMEIGLGEYVSHIVQECKEQNAIPIITCRTNYIRDLDILTGNRIPYIVLKAWDEIQINAFAKKYLSASKKDITENTLSQMQKNKELYGIPMIAYMVLSLGISVEKEDDEIDVFDRIFDKNGEGIFGRLFRTKGDAPRHYLGKTVVNKQKVRDTLNKSCEIAFQMFEAGEDKITQPFENMDDIYMDFFASFTEGKNKVEFIHKSIGAYFVAEYFIRKIEQILPKEDKLPEQNHPEILAKTLAHFCKKGKIEEGENSTSSIALFIKAKLKKLFEKKKYFDSPDRIQYIYFWWEEGCWELFQKGMLYYAYADGMIQNCSNSILEDTNCGKNVLSLLTLVYTMYNPEKNYKTKKRMFTHSRELISLQNVFLGNNMSEKIFSDYLRGIACNYYDLVLDGADLSALDLKAANLKKANFYQTKLEHADMKAVNLEMADLRNADLKTADMRNANLEHAKLNEASLENATLIFANMHKAKLFSAKLRYTDLKYANLVSADLEAADLQGADLQLANLLYANVKDASMENAVLYSANLIYAELVCANLKNANMADTRLNYADLTDCELESATLNAADFRNANLKRTNLKYAMLNAANLEAANFEKADLTSANFLAAHLKGAHLENVKAENTIFDNADLHETILKGSDFKAARFEISNLHLADLEQSDFQSADFQNANIRQSNGKNANFTNANFEFADLRGADLRYANLNSANFCFANVNEVVFSSEYEVKNQETGEIKKEKTFPLNTLGNAVFEKLYVDGKEYTREKFFECFQPDTDFRFSLETILKDD